MFVHGAKDERRGLQKEINDLMWIESMVTMALRPVPIHVQDKNDMCLLAGHVPAGTESASDGAVIASATAIQLSPGSRHLPAGADQLQAGAVNATPSPSRLPAGSHHLTASSAPDAEPALPAEVNTCLPSSPAAAVAPNPSALSPAQRSHASEFATCGPSSSLLASVAPASPAAAPAAADAGTAMPINNRSAAATAQQGVVSSTRPHLFRACLTANIQCSRDSSLMH